MPSETESVESVSSCRRYTFQELGVLSCLDGHDLTRAHQLYVISDGISALHIGSALKYRTAADYICHDAWCNTTCAHDCAHLHGGGNGSDIGGSSGSGNFSRCMFQCFISYNTEAVGPTIQPGCPNGSQAPGCCLSQHENWCAENYANGTSCVNNACGEDDCCVPDGWDSQSGGHKTETISYDEFVGKHMPAWVQMLGTPDCKESASLVQFDLAKAEVSMRQVKGLAIAEDEWCDGDFKNSHAARVMWTVNGRVMYRRCGAKGQLNMVLGGSMHDAMAESDLYQFQTCAPDRFADCNEVGQLVGNDDSRDDVFANVDESGFLYFMDSGGTDGLFGCKSKDHYGLLRTSIEVGAPFSNDFHLPQKKVLTWADGDDSPKNLTLYIAKDGFVDAAVWESLTIRLFSPRGAAVDPRRNSIEISIRDIDGPGEVTLNVNHTHQLDPAFHTLRPAPVPERGICCGGNCAEAAVKPEEATWCARATLHRSSARGNYLLYVFVSSRAASHVKRHMSRVTCDAAHVTRQKNLDM